MQQEQKDRAEIRKIVQAVLEEDRKIQRGRILYNTRILMEQYIEMRRFVETAVSEVEDMEAYTQYASLISEDTHLESVRRTKLKTAMMIVNIDRAGRTSKRVPGQKHVLQVRRLPPALCRGQKLRRDRGAAELRKEHAGTMV